jgi:hypothetical protein
MNIRCGKSGGHHTNFMGDRGDGRKSKIKMQNLKPRCKNQDSAGWMGNFPPRNLFAHIAYTYGTSFIQTHVIRQIDLFCKTKPIFEKVKLV